MEEENTDRSWKKVRVKYQDKNGHWIIKEVWVQESGG